MDIGTFSLFIKMVREDYKLSDEEIQILSHRLLADDREFEKAWRFYKSKGRNTRNGVDSFRSLLQELLN